MITLILKTTDGCNLRCRYCSIGKKNENFSIITPETMKQAGDFAARQAKKQDGRFKIILHGGEPSLVPTASYQSFMEYMKTQYGDKVSFSIQTNGLLITDEFIELLRAYNVSVGVSVDGSRSIHDSMRIDASGNGSYDKVINNMLRMIRAGINVSALVVVSPQLIKEDLTWINFFNYHGIALKLNPMLEMGEAADIPSVVPESGSYADYIISVYRYMLDNEIETEIRPVNEIFNAIINDLPMRDCSYRGGECGKNIFCIDYNGNIYPCGRFSGITESQMGTLPDNDLKSDSMIYMNTPEMCTGCKWRKWCSGGCAAVRYLSQGRPPMCTDTKRLFEYFSGEGLRLYINYLKERRDCLKSMIETGEEKDV